ncbi:neurotrimin-like isoform X2 [Lytechinus pictus]|uniref:neurotrimin-like isoform X2 n=1 Tax=Lytechinus pictus TaxID=7653 RepID=UPI0030BA0505
MSCAIEVCIFILLPYLLVAASPSVIMCTVFNDNGLLRACMKRLNVKDSKSACLLERELRECMENKPTNSTNEPVFVNDEKGLVVVLDGEDAVLPCRVTGDLKGLEVTWLKEDPVQSLSNTRNPRFDVRRKGNTTFDLFIASVGLTDEGVYICQINTRTPTSRQIELRIGRPSFIQAINYGECAIDLQVQTPTITVNESNSFYVDCIITGFPPPLLQWISLVNDIESAMNMQYVNVNGGIRLVVDNVSRDLGGDYVCRASNSYGEAEKSIRLIVQYKPSISSLPSVIYAGLNSYIKIDCDADGSPPARYRWIQNKEDEERFLTSQRSLVFVKLEEPDYGIYKCYASNLLGTASVKLEISGKPMRPTILSSVTGLRRHAYELVWSPNIVTTYGTYLSIDEFIVSYRPLHRPNTDVIFGNQTHSQWYQGVVPVSSGSEDISHVLRDLYAGTTYELVLFGRNSLGNGEGARLVFNTSLSDASTDEDSTTDKRKGEEHVNSEIPTAIALSSHSCHQGYGSPILTYCLVAIIVTMFHGAWLCG